MCGIHCAYQIGLLLIILVLVLYTQKEKLLDFSGVVGLYPVKEPYRRIVDEGYMGPRDYLGHGYFNNGVGMKTALGNTLRLLGDEFTQPNQGMTTTMALSSQNYARKS
jgi:hypothetical protein